MVSKIRNIGLGLVTVAMMSACGTDDIIDAIVDEVGTDISGDVYSDSSATAFLDGNFVAIIKNVSEDEITKARVIAKEYDARGDLVIRVESGFGCADLGLTLQSTDPQSNSVLYEYTGGGKTCYQLVYSSGSSNYGSSNVAYSSNSELDY